MSNKLEITIDVIVHATEDMTKIFQPFNEIFDIEEEIFNKTEKKYSWCFFRIISESSKLNRNRSIIQFGNEEITAAPVWANALKTPRRTDPKLIK